MEGRGGVVAAPPSGVIPSLGSVRSRAFFEFKLIIYFHSVLSSHPLWSGYAAGRERIKSRALHHEFVYRQCTDSLRAHLRSLRD